MRAKGNVIWPTLLAVALSGVYLAAAPTSEDLAAATFRADLFAEHGFALWNNDWYSGHYLLSYSVVYPPLGALLGPRLTAALAVVAAVALFAILARRRFGAASMVPSLWFAAAAAAWLLTGRVPFLLAVPFGLAALIPVRGPALGWAAALAAVAALASPVAGLFTGLAGVSLLVTGERARGACLALGAAIPIGILNLAFPTGGYEPFVFSAFIAIPLLAVVVVWLVPGEYRALRIGAVLYALLALALYIVDNPLGGNVTRLGALFAGPVLALALWPRGRWLVLAVSIPLLYWQLVAPVRDVRKSAGDPSTERAFYGPLLTELDRLAPGDAPIRIEVPPTKNRWEAAYVALEHPIARGWLRQLESEDFDLFTDGGLGAADYRDWLRRHQVDYVAVPNARLDYLAEDEVALIDTGLSYLKPVWSSPDWRLYRVVPRPRSRLSAIGVDWFELQAPRPGEYPTGLHYNRFWRVVGGDACVRDEGGSTVVEARGAGTIRVESGIPPRSCSSARSSIPSSRSSRGIVSAASR